MLPVLLRYFFGVAFDGDTSDSLKILTMITREFSTSSGK